MTTAYPYDPTGSNPECLIQDGERHEISTYYNKWRCIIPNSAPFYRKDLIIRHVETGRELREGLDYYLGHRFVAATTENKQMIYGSIFLTDTSLTGSIVFEKYRTLGGIYNTTRQRILDYLATDFDDPRNCRWEDVVKHIVDIPPLHVPEDLEDAIKTDPVTGALDSISTKIGNQHANIIAEYNKFDASITKLEGQVRTWEIATHKFDKDHVHQETFQQVKALGLNQTAKNTLQAYGRTLAELAALLNQMGIVQEDLDLHALKSGFIMEGALRITNGVAKITNHNGSTLIDLATGDIRIIATKSVAVKAANDERVDKIAGSLEAGHNMLSIHSAKTFQKRGNLVFNAAMVITAGNIRDYMPPVPADMVAIAHRDTATINIRGDGREASPIFGKVNFIEYAPGTAGTIRLTDSMYITSSNTGASSVVTSKLYTEIQKLARNSIKVNGNALTGDITISLAELGLENVSNVSDAHMPFSDAFKDALAHKSLLHHKHTVADITGFPVATETTKGLFYMSQDMTYTDKTRVAGANLMGPIMDVFNDTASLIRESMPADAINVTSYGDSSTYLPIPISGSYPPPSRYDGNRSGVLLREANGEVVGLRTADGINGTAVYYYRVEYNSTTGKLGAILPTPTKYHPTFLKGSTIKRVVARQSDLLLAIDSDDQWYLIVLNNTLDGAQHRGYRIPNIPGTEANLVFNKVGDKVYFAVCGKQPVANYQFSIFSLDYNAVISNTMPPFVKEEYVVTDRKGVVKPKSTTLNVFDKWSGDSNDNCFVDSTQTTYAMNDYGMYGALLASDGEKLRLHIAVRCWCSNSADGLSTETLAGFSVTIDPIAKTVKCDGADTYPIRMIGATWEDNVARSMAIRRFGSLDEDFPITVDQYSPQLNLWQPSKAATMYDAIKCDTSTFGISHMGGFTIQGTYPSVVTPYQLGLAYLPGQRCSFTFGYFNGNRVLCQYVLNENYGDTPSLGPSNNRVNISSQFTREARTMITKPTATDVLVVGAVFRSDSLVARTGFNASSNALSGSRTITSANYNSVVNNLIAAFNIDASKVRGKIATIYALNNSQHHAWAQLHYELRLADGTYQNRLALAKLNALPVTGDIGLPTVATTIVDTLISGGAIGISTSTICDANPGTTIQEYTGEDKAIIMLNNSPWMGYTGWGTFAGYELHLELRDGKYEYLTHKTRTWKQNAQSGYQHVPKFGYGQLVHANSVSTTLLDCYGTTYAQVNAAAVLSKPILMSVDVSASFVLYISSKVNFYTFRTMHEMEPVTFDIKAMFPSAYRNNHFYVYVIVNDNGNPEYVVKEVFEQDDDHKTYIGDFVTNHSTIISVNLTSVVRLGESREMVDHFKDTNAHNVNNMSPTLIGLDNLVNKPLNMSTTNPLLVSPAATMVSNSDNPTTDINGPLAFKHGNIDILGVDGYTNLATLTFVTRITPTTNKLKVAGYFDDEANVRIDGVQVGTTMTLGWGKLASTEFTVVPNKTVDLAIVLRNTGGGPCSGNWQVVDGSTVYLSNKNDYLMGSPGLTANISEAKLKQYCSYSGAPASIDGYGSTSQLRACRNTLSECNSISGIITGYITNGGLLPVPNGYKRSQMKYLLSPAKISPMTVLPDHTSGILYRNAIDGLSISIAVDGRVTATYTREDRIVTEPIILRYMGIGDITK